MNKDWQRVKKIVKELWLAYREFKGYSTFVDDILLANVPRGFVKVNTPYGVFTISLN